ncbi:Myb-like DNA-binding protein myb-1 [Cyberlindnera fabianii]|uniref:Myb-like DNA-binding protein myb-1 n=1 Tax=Cyberlindnera fabianii TaxID=36022 RepID=A0A1V2LDZ2_CYBFA|nr:Myb-like DNA-binding protein myb-1 [Cyberlindnera fabianii]
MGQEVRVNAIAPSASSTTLRRGPWFPEEDRKLIDSINMFGPSNWVRISQSLGTRTPKQCRERYHQNLKPSLNRNPISAEEGQLIEELVAKYGKKWAEIARHLNGRSDNAIKNWWNGGTNRRRRASSQAVLQEAQRDPQHIQPLSEYHQPSMSAYPSGPPPPHYSGYPPPHQPAFNTAIFQSQQQQQQQPVSHAMQAQQQRVQPPPHTQQQMVQPQSLPPNQQYPPQAPHQTAAPPTAPQAYLPSLQPQPQSSTQGLYLPPLNPSRSSSMNQEIFAQQAGVKRFLEEQHLPARRHSAQTILTSTGGSSSPFSSSYSRGGSSRNSSISFDWSNNTAMNSLSNSRRSSLAHELFPAPLGHQSKRQNSHSSSYLSPNIQSQRGSTSGIVPLHMTMTTPSGSSSFTQAPLPSQSDAPVFKSEFSFNATKDGSGVKLPPPSSIPSNPAFTPSALLNREKSREKLAGLAQSHAPPQGQQQAQSSVAITTSNSLDSATSASSGSTNGSSGSVTSDSIQTDGENTRKKVMNVSNLLG